MADEPRQPLQRPQQQQPNQQGPQQGQPQQGQPQPAPPKGVPGVAPPPAPPANEQEIIARQQQEVQKQIAESRRAMAEQTGQPAPAPVQPQVRSQFTAQAQPTPQAQPAPQPQPQPQLQPQAPPQPVPSPVPGLTAEQVMAGYAPPAQPGAQPGYMNEMQQSQFSQHAPPKPVEKPMVMWHPMRNSTIEIKLTDCIIRGIPDSIELEPDAQAKVVAALFSEILTMRQQISALLAGGGGASQETEGRIRRLEGALFEQQKAMQQRARGVREQIQMFSAQGMDAGQILEALQSQSQNAEGLAASAPGSTPED